MVLFHGTLMFHSTFQVLWYISNVDGTFHGTVFYGTIVHIYFSGFEDFASESIETVQKIILVAVNQKTKEDLE